ncbi:signal peptidase I [Candidatus Arthromitus sp. SFB-rat-Yit]|uniref:signal peptidase I n=1 Tax=Candidatus Arthromitus sp. SFB-rat-Yit TaxID=1041504 RepID=UPI000227A737|nr:signal peptidase I [Candidatus Arthromitus sp. SFB-rat-Yit]BAK80651.1 signal peptidase I [Candidatus Arthromitus sp. SFB-rat-Yit]
MGKYKDDKENIFDKNEFYKDEDENEDDEDELVDEYAYLLEDEKEDNTSYEKQPLPKRAKNRRHRGRLLSTILEWFITIVAALLISFLINKFLIFKVYIPSESMYPTLMVKDQLFVTKMYNKDSISRGDVLVFYSEEFKELLIKRVIGLPGDDIVVKASGEVIVNGEVLKEDYVVQKDETAIFDLNFKVPDNEYFFLGDNRANSLDSRYWNDPYISFEDIRGEARIIVYPFNRIRLLR